MTAKPEIEDCACGRDHETMPMIDISFGDEAEHYVEGVCRIHKRHVPCRGCMRDEGFYDETGRVRKDIRDAYARGDFDYDWRAQ